MATIQIRRGLFSALPTSAGLGELLFCTDTGQLFVGTGTGVEEITGAFASGTVALGTGAIAPGASAAVVTVAVPGVLITDNILADFHGDPTGIVGYQPGAMLSIVKYPTAGAINFKVCNNTGSSITPGAVTLNWRVVR